MITSAAAALSTNRTVQSLNPVWQMRKTRPRRNLQAYGKRKGISEIIMIVFEDVERECACVSFLRALDACRWSSMERSGVELNEKDTESSREMETSSGKNMGTHFHFLAFNLVSRVHFKCNNCEE